MTPTSRVLLILFLARDVGMMFELFWFRELSIDFLGVSSVLYYLATAIWVVGWHGLSRHLDAFRDSVSKLRASFRIAARG